MTEFFTIIGRKDHTPDLFADTQASSNAHNSVRSYKTLPAAQQAIKRGARVEGVKLSVLQTIIDDSGEVETRWCGGEV